MRRYILHRLLLMVPTVIGISVFIFIIMRLLPGDVATLIATRGGEGVATAEEIAGVHERLGLGDPLLVQYAKFTGGLLRLDAGTSLWTGRPVMEEMLVRLPLTAELATLSVLLSLAFGLPMGVYSALHRGTRADYLLRLASIAGLALPNFWIGVLIILFLSLYFGWIPPLGYADLATDPPKNLQQMIWPALALGYRFSAVVSRMTRSTLLEVLGEDYIRTARAKGLPETAVVLRHGLRNALLPVITLLGVQLGTLLGGTIVMETIFNLPGVGRLLIDSIHHRDYPTVQTIVLLLAVTVACINLVIDLLYTWLNPRVRYS